MGKVIGIDLGTTNSVVAVMEGGEPGRHPEPGGQPPHAVGGRLHQGRRDPRRPGRQAPGDHESREHRLLDQALHGPPLRRGAAGDQAGPVQGREGAERRRPRRDPRQAVLAARDLRDDPAEAEGSGRGLPGREGHPGGASPCPPTSTTASARPPRTPARSPASRCCASSTSRPRPRWPTASTRRRTSRSPSTTSAAARSTSRSSRSARASSRSRRPTATRTSAATTSTSASSTGSPRSSRRSTASTCARTAWRCSA